jgi:hypothetical protein
MPSQKNIEQQGIERGEHADHQAFEDQEGREVLGSAHAHGIPAGQHDDRCQEGRQQDQGHRKPVDAQVVLDIESPDPGHALDKLHVGSRRIEVCPQGQTEHEAEQRYGQREQTIGPQCRHTVAGRFACAHAPDCEDQQSAEDRQPDQYAQYSHVYPIA